MKPPGKPMALAIVTGLVTLADWAALGVGANFGIHPLLASLGLFWLATIGLPASVGVVVAAAVWGRVQPMSGLAGFGAFAVILGLACQAAAVFALGRLARARKARGKPWNLPGFLAGLGVMGISAAVVLWVTRPPLVPPSTVIDGHAHLFGDEGWPPTHKQTSGLSPAQKANPTYGMLTRLLDIPAEGDLNEAYIEAMVRQVREARQAVGSFRVVLLAQDCRYGEDGRPDWANTSVYVPNEQIFKVVRRHPDLFIACPSINPQRQDWEAELDYCLAQGARVLKIHPPTQGVSPSNQQFRGFYRKCARSGMRIMFHTGGEHSAPIASSALGDPRHLDVALDEGCTVIAAHAGTKAFFEPPAEDHFQDLLAMMDRHPQLYADTAVLGSMFRWRCIPAIVAAPASRPRMVHASDWPFPSNALVFWNRLHPVTLVRLLSEKNIFLRDILLKQALGMPPETFSQSSRLFDPQNRAESGGIAEAPPSREHHHASRFTIHDSRFTIHDSRSPLRRFPLNPPDHVLSDPRRIHEAGRAGEPHPRQPDVPRRLRDASLRLHQDPGTG